MGQLLARLPRITMTLYTAKCFWPGVTDDDLRIAASRADSPLETSDAVFRGALYLPDGEIVLCLFDSPSRASVKRACEGAGMPCERVIETAWIGPNNPMEEER